jgi:acetyl-CoA/propionyl-CoA carboxylase biotin carboxyl carrier protein
MYDPMIAKLIVWDVDREQATARMLRALGEYEIGGLKTLMPFHTAIMQSEQWAKAETCRDLIEDRKWLKELAFPKPEAEPDGKDGEEDEPKVEQAYTVEVSGKRFDVKVIGPAFGGGAGAGANGAAPAAGRRPPRRSERAAGGGGGGGDTLASPIQGTVLKVAVESGASVEEGALIAVIEAMKMENEITAHKAGTVSELPIAVGAAIGTGDTIAVITSAEAEN